MDTCTFNQAKDLIRQLVAEKEFPDDESALMQKLLWAFVQLGEAADDFKKGESWKTISEELVDVIFYVLDFIGLVEKTQGMEMDVAEYSWTSGEKTWNARKDMDKREESKI